MNERSFIVKPTPFHEGSCLVEHYDRGAARLVQQGRGLLGKLPDRRHRTDREKRIQRRFQNVSAFFFRLNQQSVARSFFHSCVPFVNEDAAAARVLSKLTTRYHCLRKMDDRAR